MVQPDTEVVETDVLILGGGMAGCGAAFEAAYWAKSQGLRVVMVEKAAVERSGAVAMGLSAINLYLGMRWNQNQPEDFVRYVRQDLMGLSREDLVYDIARHVDSSVHMFEEWGLPIFKNPDGTYKREGRWQIMIHGESYKPIVAEAAKTAVGDGNVYERIFVARLLLDDKDPSRIAGAVGFSDDGAPVYDPELMRRAFEYCLMFDRPVMNHAEILELTKSGVMHEGLVSVVLGLPGIPAAAEDVMTTRDIALAEATGGRLHVMHVSTAGSVDAIRRAKRRGVRVTAEAAPHHFSLTDEALRSFDSNFKMNPPLRGAEHVAACIAGLADGTIDAIATDHAPHAKEKKMQELDLAPFGVVGLETSLGLVVTKLIEPGHIDWPTALAKMTCNPAQILGISKGTLPVGADADVTIIDPNVRWTVDPADFRSKSSNTPFAGWELRGRAEVVIVAGRVKFSRRAGVTV